MNKETYNQQISTRHFFFDDQLSSIPASNQILAFLIHYIGKSIDRVLDSITFKLL